MLPNKRSHHNNKATQHNEDEPQLSTTRENPRTATKTKHNKNKQIFDKKKRKRRGGDSQARCPRPLGPDSAAGLWAFWVEAAGPPERELRVGSGWCPHQDYPVRTVTKAFSFQSLKPQKEGPKLGSQTAPGWNPGSVPTHPACDLVNSHITSLLPDFLLTRTEITIHP